MASIMELVLEREASCLLQFYLDNMLTLARRGTWKTATTAGFETELLIVQMLELELFMS